MRLRAGGDGLKTAKTNWAFVSVKCQSSGVANSVYKELVYKCAGFLWPTNAAFHLSQEESVFSSKTSFNIDTVKIMKSD